ncbi:hypothetical protein ACFFX0_11635 [Citricoccus parietis]|uniref:Uncharacterized protein n=1 Tax=Citricoccus parietis TaxID=592307 RepID=A0ABV5FYR2_9MICC
MWRLGVQPRRAARPRGGPPVPGALRGRVRRRPGRHRGRNGSHGLRHGRNDGGAVGQGIAVQGSARARDEPNGSARSRGRRDALDLRDHSGQIPCACPAVEYCSKASSCVARFRQRVGCAGGRSRTPFRSSAAELCRPCGPGRQRNRQGGDRQEKWNGRDVGPRHGEHRREPIRCVAAPNRPQSPIPVRKYRV